MFNNLRIFNWKNDYTSKKGEFEYPTCAYVGEEDWVYFMEPVPTVTSFDVTLSYSKTVLDASGETATPYYSFTQSVTYDNGTSKTFTGTSTYPYAEAVIIWSGCEVNGNVIADSKGTDVSEQTVVANPKITVKLNGVEATATTTIYQEANAVISTSSRGGETTYDNIVKGTITNATIPASGSDVAYNASATNGSQAYTVSDTIVTYTYTSTATRDEVTKGYSGSNTVAPSISSISATASTRGTVTGNQITISSSTVTWSANGKSASDTMYIYQAKNEVVDTWSSGGTYTYGNLVKGSVGNATISAAGGSKTVTPTNGTQTWSRTAIHAWSSYTSTAKASAITEAASSGTYTITPNPTSFNASAQSRGVVTGGQLTIKTQVVTWSSDYTNESLTSTGYIYQEANNCTTSITYSYGNITKGSITNKTIPASGGNATASVGNGSQGRTGVTTSAYTSNAELTAITVNDTLSVSPSITQLYGSANSRGTVTGNQITVTSSTVTWSLNGKSTTDTMYVYQEANSRSVKSTAVTYSDITKGTITATPSSIEYTGGTSYITATKGSQTWEEITTYSYTSKDESTAKTNSGTIEVTPTVNPTALTFTTAQGTEDICKTSTATWSANGKSASSDVRVCQSAVVVTGQSTDYIYGNITKGSVTNATIPASGSSTAYKATASNGSQPYTAITYNDFSDGHREEISRDSGTNTVSPSPSSLSATANTRGTTTGSQKTITSTTVTWSANGKSTTDTMYVYQEKNEVTSTTTARTYTWGNVTAGTITTATIPASGGTKTTTIANGDQKYTAYTATTYYYTSKDSNSANTNSTTGTSAATASTTSYSATANSRGTTIGDVRNVSSTTITWNGGGGKIASGTAYVTQEANVITSLEAVIAQGSSIATHFYYSPSTIAASGGTITPTYNGHGLVTFTSGSQVYQGGGDAYGGTFTFDRTWSGSATGFNLDTSNGSVTASNRDKTTGSSRSITVTSVLTASYKVTGGTGSNKQGTLSQSVTVSQEANKIVSYSKPVFDLWYKDGLGSNIEPSPASGGTTPIPLYDVTQTATYTSTATGNVTPNISSKSFRVSNKNTAASVTVASDGKVTFGSLGTTEQAAQHPSAVITLTLISNGVEGSDEAYIYQEENKVISSRTAYTYGNVTAGTITNATVPANGGTKTATARNGSQKYTATTYNTYTSGSECSAGTSNGTSAITPNYSSTSATGSNLGCTAKSQTTLASRTVTWTGGGSKTATGTMYVYQEANSYVRTDYTWGSVTAGTISSPTVSCTGGTKTATAGNGSQKYTATTVYTASSCTSTGTSSITPNYSSTSATGSNLGCTTSSTKTLVSRSVTWTGGGSKTATGTMYVYQEANSYVRTDYTWGSVTAGTILSPTVSCTGGTKTATAGSGSQKYTATTVYCASSCTSTGTSSITPNYSSTSATGSNLGTTETSRKTLVSRSVTWTGGGSKTAAGTMYVYQEANTYTTSASTGTSQGTTTWGAVTCGAISNATVPASGGTKTATAGNGSQSWSRVDTPYTSYTYTFCTNQTSSKTVNGTSTTVTGTTTISPSVSSISATGSNRGTTTGSSTTLKSQAVTWSGNGGKSCSGTMYVYQQENSAHAEIRITGVDTFMACQECINPSATATISYTSGKESSTSSGITLYCDGNLSKYGDTFCYDNERGSGLTDRITAKYSIGSKSYYGYSSIISLNDWSC